MCLLVILSQTSLLTEETRLQIFGTSSTLYFFKDGHSVYSIANLFPILGTSEKTCLVCTGTPLETFWTFWQLCLSKVDLLHRGRCLSIESLRALANVSLLIVSDHCQHGETRVWVESVKWGLPRCGVKSHGLHPKLKVQYWKRSQGKVCV